MHTPTLSPRRQILLDVGITVGLGLALLAALLLFHPPAGTAWHVVNGLHLTALVSSPEGSGFTAPGTVVTATFELRNDGPQRATLEAFQAAARGPDACTRGWTAVAEDFPTERVTLDADQDHLYREVQVFATPGVYFAEPVKQEGGQWGGLAPYPRVWFRVIDPTTGRLPADCATPGPTRGPATPPSLSKLLEALLQPAR